MWRNRPPGKLEETMTEYALKLISLGHTEAKKGTPTIGTVSFDKVATFAGLPGQSVRCISGYLWLTVENDRDDHVIHLGDTFQVPTKGKVIVGGKGRYAIEPSSQLARAI
jgi:uncharacterized protein YaiE (UPF0345 family)